jgi:hypothetical protein
MSANDLFLTPKPHLNYYDKKKATKVSAAIDIYTVKGGKKQETSSKPGAVPTP